MTQVSQTLTKISKLIEKNERFLICSHENPDGDAVGASLGLGFALRDLGKTAVVYNKHNAPPNTRILPGHEQMIHTLPDPDQFDAVLVLDCGELSRIGDGWEKISPTPNLVNIDHHKTNNRFGELNLVEAGSSSTGELIYRLLEQLAAPISKETATCLFMAIYTDTVALSTESASADTFHICGELTRSGIDTFRISREYYFVQSEKKVRLMARALGSLKVEPNGKVAGVTLLAKDLVETETGPEDVEGFIEFPRNIRGVEAAYFLREQDSFIKGSLRSSDKVDSAVIAESLGGGGHARAAGFRTTGTLEEVRTLLIKKINDFLEQS